MTDERVDTGPKTASPDSVEPDEYRIHVAFNDALRQQIELGEHEPVLRELWAFKGSSFEPEQWLLLTALVVYSKAFLETLARRHADAVADLVRKRVRRKDKPDEYRIGVNDGSAATIVITEDLPDEARLALLDLDVTDDAVRGKVLRWDGSASAWRPADES